MPVTQFQSEVCKLLAKNRSPDSHLAGGAALHFEPNSLRYSVDLDYFHDSEKRVAEAFAADRQSLEQLGYVVQVEINQPGYILDPIDLTINKVLALAGRDEARDTQFERDSLNRNVPGQTLETFKELRAKLGL